MNRVPLKLLENAILAASSDVRKPAAVCFVDMHTEYLDFVGWNTREGRWTGLMHLHGIPVFSHSSTEGVPEGRLATLPGVWLEMSLGKPTRVDIPKEVK